MLPQYRTRSQRKSAETRDDSRKVIRKSSGRENEEAERLSKKKKLNDSQSLIIKIPLAIAIENKSGDFSRKEEKRISTHINYRQFFETGIKTPTQSKSHSNRNKISQQQEIREDSSSLLKISLKIALNENRESIISEPLYILNKGEQKSPKMQTNCLQKTAKNLDPKKIQNKLQTKNNTLKARFKEKLSNYISPFEKPKKEVPPEIEEKVETNDNGVRHSKRIKIKSILEPKKSYNPENWIDESVKNRNSSIQDDSDYTHKISKKESVSQTIETPQISAGNNVNLKAKKKKRKVISISGSSLFVKKQHKTNLEEDLVVSNTIPVFLDDYEPKIEPIKPPKPIILNREFAIPEYITKFYEDYQIKFDNETRSKFFSSFLPESQENGLYLPEFSEINRENQPILLNEEFKYDVEIVTNKNKKEKIKVTFQPGKAPPSINEVPNHYDKEARERFFRQLGFDMEYRSGYAPINMQKEQDDAFNYKQHFIKKKQSSASIRLKRLCGVSYIKPSESQQLNVQDIWNKLPPLVFQGSNGCTKLDEYNPLMEQVLNKILNGSDQQPLVVSVMNAEDEILFREYVAHPEKRLQLINGKIWILQSFDCLWQFVRDRVFLCLHLNFDKKQFLKKPILKNLSKEEILRVVTGSDVQIGILCKKSLCGKKSFVKSFFEGDISDEEIEEEEQKKEEEKPKIPTEKRRRGRKPKFSSDPPDHLKPIYPKISHYQEAQITNKLLDSTKNYLDLAMNQNLNGIPENYIEDAVKDLEVVMQPYLNLLFSRKLTLPQYNHLDQESITQLDELIKEKTKTSFIRPKPNFEHLMAQFENKIQTEEQDVENNNVEAKGESNLEIKVEEENQQYDIETELQRILERDSVKEENNSEIANEDGLETKNVPNEDGLEIKLIFRDGIVCLPDRFDKDERLINIQEDNLTSNLVSTSVETNFTNSIEAKTNGINEQQIRDDMNINEVNQEIAELESIEKEKEIKIEDQLKKEEPIFEEEKDNLPEALSKLRKEFKKDPKGNMYTISLRVEIYTLENSWKTSSKHTKNLLYTFSEFINQSLLNNFRNWTNTRLDIYNNSKTEALEEVDENIHLIEFEPTYDPEALKRELNLEETASNWDFDPSINNIASDCDILTERLEIKKSKNLCFSQLQDCGTSESDLYPLSLPLYIITTRDSFAFDLIEKISFLDLDGRKVKKTEFYFDPNACPANFKSFVELFPDYRVGVVTYQNFFSHEEMSQIEAKCYETERKFFLNHYLPMTGQMSSSGDKMKRTKFFFGARYIWTKQQLCDPHSRVGAGIRVDVSEPPEWMRKLVERPLVKNGIIEKDFINSFAMNVYHDGKEGLAQHFDDAVRFRQPIFTLRLFSDSRLSFGSQLYGFCNGAFCIPMPRGCITVLEVNFLEESYAANGIKHCVRPCDMTGKSAALILRQMHHKVFNEAKIYDEYVDFPTWFSTLSIKDNAVCYNDQKRFEADEILKAGAKIVEVTGD